jgi:hypothetical protein
MQCGHRGDSREGAGLGGAREELTQVRAHLPALQAARCRRWVGSRGLAPRRSAMRPRSAWGGPLVAVELSPAAPRAGMTLALSPHNMATVDRILRRDHNWQPIARTLRDGLMAAITR